MTTFFGNGRRLGSPRLITLIVGMALLLFHCSPVNAEPPQARTGECRRRIGTIAAASVTGIRPRLPIPCRHRLWLLLGCNTIS